jgi:hypothetical protein
MLVQSKSKNKKAILSFHKTITTPMMVIHSRLWYEQLVLELAR